MSTFRAQDVEAELAPSRFGVQAADVVRLGGEIDRTYRVTSVDGDRFSLKISPDLERPELENRVLEHLAANSLGVEIPHVVRAADGSGVVTLDSPAGPQDARLLTWVSGTLLADLPWRSPDLLRDLGETAGRMVLALADLDTAGMHRSHRWDLRVAPATIAGCVESVDDPHRRALVDRVLALWQVRVAPLLERLPTATVHHDLTDFNVLARPDEGGSFRVAGVIDVGDALHGLRAAEVTIAAAYATLRSDDPLGALAAVVAGFDEVVPLTDDELAAIFPLAAARLCTNATVWTHRLTTQPEWLYAKARSEHTWAAIEAVEALDAAEVELVLRAACGRQPDPRNPEVVAWLREATPSPIVDGPLGVDAATRSGTPAASAPQRRRTGAAEPATLHLGSDIAAPDGAEVRAPFDGVVSTAMPGLVVLEHTPAPGLRFSSVFRNVRPTVAPGESCAAGAPLGAVVGGVVHVQLSCSGALPPTDVPPSRFAAWSSASPDPATLLFGAPPDPRWHVDDVLNVRGVRVASSQRSYYQRPPNLVRSEGVWFVDDNGFSYLDAVNNVTHVGHCHPRVVEAATRQMGLLNTNSRFVYEGLARYADRLAATFPDPLEVVFFVCTGSEANDLALRMARTCTGRDDVVVIDGAYHGNTTAVTGISPNRYDGPGGRGAPPTTHAVPQPDRYRGVIGYDDPEPGSGYAALGMRVIDDLVGGGRPPAAFFAESLMGTGGQIVLPDGYLAEVFAAVRAAGGLCVSDEVQVGVGRLGDSFWGFECQGVVPDIVTIGKSIGNGHPMAAVVTTREIADAFDTGMKYFNTFAGNPVSCAVGMAVLDVIEDEGLQARSREVGGYLLDRLRGLQERHELIGDVRGKGLYVGIELVRDRATKVPAVAEAYRISERMKDEGVIVYPNGTLDNVLKLKPPMVFGREHVDLFVEALDQVLTEGW